MIFSYEIFPEKNLLIERFEGEVNLANFLTSANTVFNDPLYHPAMNGIANFEKAILDFDFSEMYALVDYLRASRFRSTGRWAFITTRPINFGVARMFYTMAEGLQGEIKFFNNERDAVAWLTDD